MATVKHRKVDRTSIAFLRKGQEFYASQKYDHAEKALLRAMDMCTCGVAVQNQPRIDHEILKAIEQKRLKEVLASMSASSKRCGNPVHVDALDSLIATYEMQFRLNEGLEFALKMVNLSPREPKSYLRLGKVLRLKSLPTTAYCNYKQGIELVRRKHPHHALLHKLQAQKDKILPYARFDPITILPIELVRMIFKHLDFKTRCGCLGVSKTWKIVLTGKSLKSLWQVQEYKITGNSHPGLRRIRSSFESNVRYATGALTELSIHNCSSFFQFCSLQQALFLAPQLKVLKLRQVRGICYLEGVPGQFKLPSLMNLSLGHGVYPTPRLVQQLLDSSCDSLEELSIFGLQGRDRDVEDPVPDWDPNWPKLEKLKVIRLSCVPFRDRRDRVTDINRVMELTPNIEEAWIGCVTWKPEKLLLCWPKLRSLFVALDTRTRHTSGNQPQLNREMRELHVECRWNLLSLVPSLHLPYFHMLEKLSLVCEPLSQDEFMSLVRPSLESGTLRELDIRPLPVLDFFKNFPLPDWFKSDSITYLSLTGFTQELLYEDRMFEEVVLAIINRFPNLRSVDIADEIFPDTLLAKFIQKGVKTIYCHKAPPRVDLRNWASKKFGAELIMGSPPHLPAAHPERNNLPQLPR
ncbi:hypothetical protein F4776DRAFT_611297 [Hypoxylon sp. NC0597]|nr:hypothetical protein F4776DRAFT_611297 [Hypoxylon sp. NC0597]